MHEMGDGCERGGHITPCTHITKAAKRAASGYFLTDLVLSSGGEGSDGGDGEGTEQHLGVGNAVQWI